jgi:hypothetical protein
MAISKAKGAVPNKGKQEKERGTTETFVFDVSRRETNVVALPVEVPNTDDGINENSKFITRKSGK